MRGRLTDRLARLEVARIPPRPWAVFVADDLEGEAFVRWRAETAAAAPADARLIFVQIVNAVT